MQALLRSNLPAIDSLRYAVTLLRDGTSVLSLCVTDIATWLRKPAVFLAGTYYMDNLLRSNLPAIDSLRYAVTLLRDGTSVLSLCVTDIATWLRKPAVFLAGTYYMDNLLSVNREVPGHMFLFSPIKVKCRILKKADLMAARNCQRSFI